VGVSAHVFDYVPFDERYTIGSYELSDLNLHVLVMLTAYLFIAVFV